MSERAAFPKAVLFDLLTALLDSWTAWNAAAGSEVGGRAWRAEYLRLTYGCGAYVPYEELVLAAARRVGLDDQVATRLEDAWLDLQVWSGAQEALDAIGPRARIGIVTNCSQRLGRMAAGLLKTRWDCVITAQDAGFYKPDPHPYQLAMQALSVTPAEAAFVAGSGFDLIGTARVGLRTYWHNRVGLARPDGAPAPDFESQTLHHLMQWLERS
jgi:2-haloacid dehalogenase